MLAPIPSGAQPKPLANPVQTTCPAFLTDFKEGICTAAENIAVGFLCDESDLQVRNCNRFCCGNENPERSGSKTVSETDESGLSLNTEESFRQFLRAVSGVA